MSSLRSLLLRHETIRMLGLDNSYTAAYISDLKEATYGRFGVCGSGI
ncbi:MAG: hypothetical protein MJ014_08760 [Methanocorpusculum sp.]|nr:hypothetical protein [Methanocorpusculum sp.]